MSSCSCRLASRGHDRLDDFDVAGAAAEIAGKRLADLGFAGMRVTAQQRFGRHDHSGRAEAALRAELFVEGLLQPVRPALLGETFDRLDLAAFATHGERYARWYGFTVDQHGAGAAFTAVAAGLGAGEMRDLAQVIDEQRLVGDGVLAPAAVHADAEQAFSRSLGWCVHEVLRQTFESGRSQKPMTKVKRRRPGFGPRGNPDGSQG